MKIYFDHPLDSHTTFGVTARAAQFIRVEDVVDIPAALEIAGGSGKAPYILGGGSNVLITEDLAGAVLSIGLRGIETEEHGDEVIVTAAAGENWHELVEYCVERGWGGIENLALIPGSVGAAPVQNIGAYGVELADVVERVTVYDTARGESCSMTPAECYFSYRDSIFKQDRSQRRIITSVSLRLSRTAALNTSYGAIEQELAAVPADKRSFRDVFEAVIRIRQSKLPDPQKIGNAGSFFKNPNVHVSLMENLRQDYPDIPAWQVDEDTYKIPAGWMIEQCGLKGVQQGKTGTYEKQALVIVNYGGATGEEIWRFAQYVRRTVKRKFGFQLAWEVNVW